MAKAERRTVEFISGLAKILKPKEQIKVSEWADAHMVLPAGSAVSGKFSCDNVPYQREIMDAITDPEIRDVTVMSSAQIGKTTIILAGMGYYIDHEPATQMMIMPTIATMEKFSKSRLANMISEIPELKEKIADPKARNSNNTILYKEYAGGYMVLSGANSPASLSSFPIRIVWMDEIDRFPESAGSEGNPLRLAEERATSYWNKKFFKSSTPTTATESKIYPEYKKGTQEEWCVQCPCCGTFQPYDWQRVDFNTGGMRCADCEELIEEKFWKDSEHKWIVGNPDVKNHRSFHLNALASPWVKWEDLIAQFKSAYDKMQRFHDPTDLQTFYNLKLGEIWDDTRIDTKSQSSEDISKRAEIYGCEVPDDVILLTAAVDVQENRFEVEIRGWARDYETWGIYKTEIYGDIERDDVWNQLEQYITQTLKYSDGREIGIAGTAIDTGGSHTQAVYQHCQDFLRKGISLYPIKGYAGTSATTLLHSPSKADVTEITKDGKKITTGMIPLQILGVNVGKDMIVNHLTIEEPGPGYCHFPADKGRGYDEEYYEGLTSEKKITTRKSGRIKTMWVKTPGVRNEPFDLFNYNLACSMLRRPAWSVLEAKREKGIDYTKTSETVNPAPKKRRRYTVKSELVF